jgi:hypothetical protein
VCDFVLITNFDPVNKKFPLIKWEVTVICKLVTWYRKSFQNEYEFERRGLSILLNQHLKKLEVAPDSNRG